MFWAILYAITAIICILLVLFTRIGVVAEVPEPIKQEEPYNPEKHKSVYSIYFQCSSCNTEWKHEYPKGVGVGYCNFGLPSSRHGWVIDNFDLKNIKTPYNYHCPTCDNIDDIDIVRREPLLLTV